MAPQGGKTFISYARDDSEFALKLAGDLRAAGANVWLDRFDIPVGADWPRAVQEALDSCSNCLVVLSPASVGSNNVMAEMNFALDEGKRIFPVLYQECKRPFRVRSSHHADFTTDYQAGFSALVSVLDVERAPPPEARIDSPLEKTMSNPRYTSDLKSLELNNFDLSTILDQETILLVVGIWIGAELLDRPVAELLRDEIDRRGGTNRCRRGIVVTDRECIDNSELRVYPAIAIGGPSANSLTRELDETAPRNSKWSVGRMNGVFVAGPPPRVGLWGPNATNGRLSAERYIGRSDGLESFLKLAWK